MTDSLRTEEGFVTPMHKEIEPEANLWAAIVAQARADLISPVGKNADEDRKDAVCWFFGDQSKTNSFENAVGYISFAASAEPQTDSMRKELVSQVGVKKFFRLVTEMLTGNLAMETRLSLSKFLKHSMFDAVRHEQTVEAAALAA